MPRDFSSDEWRGILQLAREASALPKSERRDFLQSKTPEEAFVAEALELAEQFDLEPDEPLGRQNTIIGRFQLLDYLGSGGSGEVYTADDPELRRQVAIKIFRPDLTASAFAQQRFIREARAASALNHPNIVTVYEIVRSDTRIAIVMELVPGSPLRNICGAEVEPKVVFSIGQQVAAALSAAHSSGIVHRDIKPENIMMLPDGRVKVLDFGLARQMTSEANASVYTVPGGIPGGTLRYMSPEHFRTQPVTAKSDIFALGLVLCELASRQHPFNQRPTDSPFEVFNAIGTQEVPSMLVPPGRYPPLFEATLRAMLAKDPEMRPDAERVAAALQECSLQANSADRGPTENPRSAWWKWAAIAAVVLAVAVTAGIVVLQRDSAAPKFTNLQRVTNLVADTRATATAISPDGERLSYANIDGVFIQSLESGEVNMLHGPPEFVVDHLVWTADGSRLIASGFSSETNRPAIWSVPANGKAAQELRTEARYGVPSRDGTQIAFISGDHSSIGIMDIDGQDAEVVLQVPPDDSLHLLLWSFNGRHLIMQRQHLIRRNDPSTNAFTWSLDAFDLKSRKVTGSRGNQPDVRLSGVAALPGDAIAFISPDNYPPEGRDQMWSIRLDPDNGRFSSPPQPLVERTLLRELPSSSLSATTDGSKVLILRQAVDAAVFVARFNRAALQLSNSRRLTLVSTASYPHAWTPDNQHVIFESAREGTSDLYKQHIDRRLPEPILSTAKRWELLPQVSPDGKHVLFASTPNSVRPFTLMRVAIEGGSTESVPADGPLDEFRCSVSPKGRCVLRKTVGQSEFVYYDLHPIQGIGRELARTAWVAPILGDWDVSPDGKFVAVPLRDRHSAKVRLIRLDPKGTEPKEREVVLAGPTQLAGVTWAVDGTGWFASIETTVGRRVYFTDLQGHITSLGDISGLAVPSPDGARMAFLNAVIDANAWLLTEK